MVFVVIDALQPMEREMVEAIRIGGEMTTGEVYDALAGKGRHTSRAGVRTRLALLARFGVVIRSVPAEYGKETRWRLAN